MPNDSGRNAFILASLIALAAAAGGAQQLNTNTAPQQAPFPRLPAQRFEVTAPSARVAGAPGRMTVRQTTCRAVPSTEVRRRIVDVAVQEWAFFGFSIVDQTAVEDDGDDIRPADQPRPRRRGRLDPVEAERVAASVAGYWTATPEGGWVVGRQNEAWNGPDGIATRWQYPWSAAFISWVMCEGGLGTPAVFQRAAAHHAYIDQAIRARDGRAAQASFVAYDAREAVVEPGDLICSARRPAYRNIAQRRTQMGQGARTHCDVVVKVDARNSRILAIGGNVRGRVSLKQLSSTPDGRTSATAFVHLKLRGPSIPPDAMDGSPTMQAIGCGGVTLPAVVAANPAVRRTASC